MATQRDGDIAWTDETWNPIRGCTRVSRGCGGPGKQGGCYAERLAIRFAGPGQPYEGLVQSTSAGPRWTGVVRTVPELLDQPLRWRRPRRVFVNSMSDLFHEDLPDEFILECFRVMKRASHHTFQILTKRAERMRSFMSRLGQEDHVLFLDHLMGGMTPHLNHVWLGVSVEDQATADERIPLLLHTPAAVRFISAEPLLGPIDLTRLIVPVTGAGSNQPAGPPTQYEINALDGSEMLTDWHGRGAGYLGASLDWVIAGGESGPNARPSHLDWFRSLREQCAAADVKFFMKQITERGRKIPYEAFPTDLMVREYPDAQM